MAVGLEPMAMYLEFLMAAITASVLCHSGLRHWQALAWGASD